MKTLLKFVLITVLLFSIFDLSNTQDRKGKLIINVYGFKNNDGKARILIFKTGQEEFYPSKQQKAYLREIVPIKNKKVIYEFKDIPYGDYAISVHHDEDNNGKVNTNWIGIPNEGLGASNDAKGNFGPPSFDQAKITLNQEKMSIKINIVN